MIKICLTGVTGFIGSKLLIQLLKLSHEVFSPVRNLDSNLFYSHKNLKLFQFRYKENKTDYSELLKQSDIVIHCAARVHVMKMTEKETLLKYRMVNVDETLNLAKQAALYRVKRFIFLSSVKVNGEETLGEASFEYNDKSKPQDAYAISKWEAEQALIQLSKQTGLEVVIIRAPLVYGEGVKGNFLSLLDLVYKQIPLPLANINNLRSFIGLDNLIDLIICCINHPKAAGKIFLVSDTEDISTPSLIKKMSIFMKKPSKLFPIPIAIIKLGGRLIGKSLEINRLLGSLRINSSYACEQLGWKPPFSLDKGLEKTVNWYLKNR